MTANENNEGRDLAADGCAPCQGTGRITHIVDGSWVPCTACARRRQRMIAARIDAAEWALGLVGAYAAGLEGRNAEAAGHVRAAAKIVLDTMRGSPVLTESWEPAE